MRAVHGKHVREGMTNVCRNGVVEPRELVHQKQPFQHLLSDQRFTSALNETTVLEGTDRSADDAVAVFIVEN